MAVVLLLRCVKRKSTSEGQGGGVVPCMFCIGIAVKILATVNARQHIAFLSWVGRHGVMMHQTTKCKIPIHVSQARPALYNYTPQRPCIYDFNKKVCKLSEPTMVIGSARDDKVGARVVVWLRASTDTDRSVQTST